MTKAQILEILEPILFNTNLFEVKMDVIGKTVGISRPTLYYYFPSKESLISDLVEYSAAKWFPAIEKRLTEGDIDAHIDWLVFGWIESRCLFARSFVMKAEYEKTPLEEIVLHRMEEWLTKMDVAANGAYWNFSTQRTELVTYAFVWFSKSALFRWIDNVSKEERTSTVRELRKMYF